MTYNEAETRYYLIDPVLREKGYDDHQWKGDAGKKVRKSIDQMVLVLTRNNLSPFH